MITAPETGVNGAPPRAVMMSVGDIARRDGVSVPNVSRRVKRLVEQHQLHVERDPQGRVALVNVVQYDELKNRFGDPSKAQAPARPSSSVLPSEPNESLDEARRVLTWTEAERAKLKLEAEQRLYVRVEELESALGAAAEAIIDIVDRLPQASDDLAAAVARDGVAGLRNALKRMAVDYRTEIADALSGVAHREES